MRAPPDEAVRLPAYSVLDCGKALRDGHIALRHWREALDAFIRAQAG